MCADQDTAIHVRVIEQISSLGKFQKKQMSSWEKNTEQMCGLDPSLMAALWQPEMACCGSLCPFGTLLSIGWSGTPSFSASQAQK